MSLIDNHPFLGVAYNMIVPQWLPNSTLQYNFAHTLISDYDRTEMLREFILTNYSYIYLNTPRMMRITETIEDPTRLMHLLHYNTMDEFIEALYRRVDEILGD